jgi:hypothetical protein
LARGGHQFGEIDGEGVGFDYFEAGGVVGLEFGDGADGAAVDLDGGDGFGIGFEEGAGEAAGAGADFDDVAAGEVAGLAGDARDQVGVQQEVLAERFSGVEAVGADDLAQWGQRGKAGRVRRRCLRRVDRSPPGAAGRASAGGTQARSAR